VTAEPFLEPHVAGDGALHLIRRGHGAVLTLSRPQLRLLVAMADRPSGLSRAEVAAVLWGVAVTPSRRRESLRGAQRTSQARTLRRLRSAGLVEDLGNIALAPEGQRLMRWLMGEWRGWAAYTGAFPDVPPAELDRRSAR
jgi:hypothetical protein